MISPVEVFCGYNARGKCYPDGTAVFTYSNDYCFRIPFDSNKKEKTDLIDFTKLDSRELADIFNDHYIYFDYNLNRYYFHHSYVFEICIESLYISFLAWESLDKWFPQNNAKKEEKKRADSVRRSREKIYDLVMCNEWSYFFTGTLGKTKFDPTNAKEALAPLQDWLKNAVRRKGLRYILVAELQPKSKHIHFHGFINDVLEMVDSNTKLYRGCPKAIYDSTAIKRGYKVSDGHIVYNVPLWKFGFTHAIKTYNGPQFAARYFMKYITKENKEVFGRYYWSSRNLQRSPDMVYDTVDFDGLNLPSYSIPNTKRAVKYYTFFNGQGDFHFVDAPEGFENNWFDSPTAMLYCPSDPKREAAEKNTASIISELELYENLHDYSLNGFVEV